MREVERLVSGRAQGDRPTDAPRPDRVKHVLRFEVSAETLAAFREAMRHVAEQSGQHLAADDALLLIARGILDVPLTTQAAGGASTDSPMPSNALDTTHAGRARYQISITECPRCKRAHMPAGADLLEIGVATLAAARCDAQHVAPLPEARDDSDTDGAVPTAGWTDEPHGRTRAEPTHGDERTRLTHVGLGAADARPARTTSAIPPALRRHVWERDHHTCQVPGCRNHVDIEVHHIRPRAEGGPNHARNLICICSVHHRAVHAGQLHLSGSADDLRVFHADGTPHGGSVSAARSDASEKVFRGLRWLGFKEREARAAIAAALRDLAASPELAHDDAALLRQALAHLGGRAGSLEN